MSGSFDYAPKSPLLCDRSAKRFAQDDDFVGELAIQLVGDAAGDLWSDGDWNFAEVANRPPFFRDCATVLGEEIGWRGFLVPELAKRHSFAATAIISGLIWAVWHYPIFLLADGYSGGTPVWYYLPLFTLLLPAISFLWTWMRLKSGSIWPGVVLHAAHNTFIQQFFDPLTIDKSKTRYIAGEFGVGLAVISILMAFYFWKRRNEVTPAATAVTTVATT